MAGYVSSADTGNEDLVMASRAALAGYCETSAARLGRTRTALLRNLGSRQSQGQDRIVVPTLEVIAFLFYAGLFSRDGGDDKPVNYRNVCLLVQRSGYKTGNVRKLEACVKVYGAVAGLESSGRKSSGREVETEETEEPGAREARKRLGALLLHPWPRIRSLVVDELWGLLSLSRPKTAEKLKGIDCGSATKEQLRKLVDELGLN